MLKRSASSASIARDAQGYVPDRLSDPPVFTAVSAALPQAPAPAARSDHEPVEAEEEAEEGEGGVRCNELGGEEAARGGRVCGAVALVAAHR